MSDLLLLPAVEDIGFQRGDTLPLEVTLTDVDGLPVDLTGALFAADVRESSTTPTVLASFTVTVVDAAGGVLLLELPPLMTGALPTHSVWDLQVTWPDGTVQTVVGGRLRGYGDVTR